MLREEFENRMGNTVTPEAYNDIEELYYAAGDMDKDTFCDDYKLHGASKILAEIWDRYKTSEAVLKIYKEEHQAAAEMLLRLHDEYGIKEAYDMAQTMIDLRGIVKYKLENGKQLTSIEREYVMSKI
jgi:hypothetical protein